MRVNDQYVCSRPANMCRAAMGARAHAPGSRSFEIPWAAFGLLGASTPKSTSAPSITSGIIAGSSGAPEHRQNKTAVDRVLRMQRIHSVRRNRGGPAILAAAPCASSGNTPRRATDRVTRGSQSGTSPPQLNNVGRRLRVSQQLSTLIGPHNAQFLRARRSAGFAGVLRSVSVSFLHAVPVQNTPPVMQPRCSCKHVLLGD